MVARGEVWWYEEPDSKARPMLVLTRDEAIPVLHEVIGVPATSRIRGIASEVQLGPADGMPRDCVLAVDNTQRVRRSYLTTRITVLNPIAMQQVCEALRFVVDC